MPVNNITTITAADQWSSSMALIGWFNISVRNTNTTLTTLSGATVTLQRSFNNGVVWRDVRVYANNAEEYGFEPEGALYRIGIKAAQYGTSSIEVRLGQEGGMTK